METHEHHHEMTQSHESWLSRHRWISYGALAVIAYYLLTEHREHILPYLPFLFLAACPLMHLFMHGDHGGHHEHHHDENQDREKKS